MKTLAIFLCFLALAAQPAMAGDKTKSDFKPGKEADPLDWCDWLSDKPGRLYKDKKNPWIDEVEIKGRVHLQAGHVSGRDVRGNHFSEDFDDLRRLRLSTELGFLKFFDLDIGVNLVEDNRYRAAPDDDLDLGYETFDSAALTFDIGEAFGRGPLDELKITYGRMKLDITEEVRTSSNKILTLERSAISDKLGGEESRPTGVTIDVEKGDWSGTLGIFSGEDDADFIGGWNDGEFYYGSVSWRMTDKLRFTLDHVQNNESGTDDALQYAQATSLAAIYETKRWGILVNAMSGDNGGVGNGKLLQARQGDFHGAVVMPWYWLVKNRLQLVTQYQYAASDESEGFRLRSRYVRALHSPPRTDFDNGYGDENHSYYLGLNYHICENAAKIMGGVSYDTMDAPTGRITATTYLIGFRSQF